MLDYIIQKYKIIIQYLSIFIPKLAQKDDSPKKSTHLLILDFIFISFVRNLRFINY